jgi:hypothetical protein
LHALIDTRKKTGAPELLATIRSIAARDKDDESGEVLILGAKAIDNPRA